MLLTCNFIFCFFSKKRQLMVVKINKLPSRDYTILIIRINVYQIFSKRTIILSYHLGVVCVLPLLLYNSNTVWFNFQTYIIFSINLVSFKVTLRSGGTDILYGCHLLLDVCIIYFISCDCIMNSSLSYTIY